QDYQQRLLAWAADEVRGQVSRNAWQAFWQTAVDAKSAKEVAQALGMTTAAVYLAKSRVMARLKELVQQWQTENDDNIEPVIWLAAGHATSPTALRPPGRPWRVSEDVPNGSHYLLPGPDTFAATPR